MQIGTLKLRGKSKRDSQPGSLTPLCPAIRLRRGGRTVGRDLLRTVGRDLPPRRGGVGVSTERTPRGALRYVSLREGGGQIEGGLLLWCMRLTPRGGYDLGHGQVRGHH